MQNIKTYQYTLDFSDCSTVYDAYRAIDKQFDLPIQCGENLNAFWDVLTGFIGRPAQITVCRKTKNKDTEELLSELLAVLHEAENDGILKITVIEND
ncbi:MAG: barstar family protein [Clostridia bacterium]|nr:barstar family protein [Clostridia bacterium]